jgi:hypothetical protein
VSTEEYKSTDEDAKERGERRVKEEEEETRGEEGKERKVKRGQRLGDGMNRCE